MRSLFAASIALLTLTASGGARADPVAPQSWNGWYTGGNLGYGWGRSDTSATFLDMFNNVTPGPVLLTTRSSFDMNGVIGGLQAGGNWQNGNWVFGFEADIQAADQKATKSFTCPAANCSSPGINTDLTAATVNYSQKLDWFGTVRGRIGVANPATLVYFRAGLAYGHIKSSDLLIAVGTAGPTSTCPGPTCGLPISTGSTTKIGYAVGVGAEQRLFGNWSSKIEFLFVDLGKVNFNRCCFPTGAVSSNAVPIQVNLGSKITDSVLRLGLNYQY